MTGFSTQGSHSGILWTQKLRAPVENLELTSRFPRWVPTENKYVPKCVIVHWYISGFLYIFFYIVFCPQVTCDWRDVKIQELRRGRGHSKCGLWTWHEHDRLLVTASALNTADAEEYRRTMTHWTVHTLNATDTELTLNATDSEPHWQLNTRLNTTNTE